jgi:hypothetical protein
VINYHDGTFIPRYGLRWKQRSLHQAGALHAVADGNSLRSQDLIEAFRAPLRVGGDAVQPGPTEGCDVRAGETA